MDGAKNLNVSVEEKGTVAGETGGPRREESPSTSIAVLPRPSIYSQGY